MALLHRQTRRTRRSFRPRLLALEDRTVPAGGRDPTFGTGGLFSFDINGTDHAYASALQPDGKIILAGDTGSSHHDFALARLLPDGTLDPTFGNGGRVVSSIASRNDTIFAVAVLPDGKILAAGSADMDLYGNSFGFVRFNPDGSRDATFSNTDGIRSVTIGTGASCSAMALLPDGKFLLAGTHGTAANDGTHFAVVRFHADGTLDPTFGVGGVASANVGATSYGELNGVAVQPDGKIVLAGKRNSSFVASRFNADGTLDTSFDGDGLVVPTIPGYVYGGARDLALQPDGRILLAGAVSTETNQVDLALVRLLPDGAFDPTLDGDGRATLNLGGGEDINGIVLQADGRIVTVGTRTTGAGAAHVTRFNTDGTPDLTFGTGGTAYSNFGSGETYTSVLIQPDGKIVASGYSSGTASNFVGGRFLPGASVLVSPRSLATAETGGTVQFSVVLSQVPTDNVVLPLTMSDPDEATLSVSQLVFTPANALVPQVVTLTALDDPYDDGDVNYSVRVGAASSADPEFQDVRGSDVRVVNVDDDTAGILVTPTSGLVTNETGPTSTSFTVVLTCLPRGNVTIGLGSSRFSDGFPVPPSITFTPANAFTPQTVAVMGADDQVDDDDVFYTIVTGAATSAADPGYNGLNADDLQVLSIDNDTAGIDVQAATPIVTTEFGGTATFTVRLVTIPRNIVTIGVSSSLTSEGTVAPTSLVFQPNSTALNPRTVTVTGVDDIIIDGDQPYTVVLGAATSTDMKYAGINPLDVSAVNQDDDAAGFVVTPISGLTTTEGGGTATFTIRLRSTSTANVTIDLSSTNLGEGTVSPASLTFTPASAYTPQTVTIIGVNDGVIDGPVTYAIVTASAVSGDLDYNGLNPPDVTATNLDDDPIGIAGYLLNGGAVQRSMVTSFAFTFSQVVTLGPSAFRVRRIDDGYEPSLLLTPTVANGRTTVTATFTGPGVIAGSVPDGIYALTVSAAQITDPFGQPLDGDGNGQPGGDFAVNFHRLFGDVDGNRSINAFDLSQFRPAFGTVVGNANYRAYLDFDGNGAINAFDFAQFRDRFGVTLIGPP